MESIRISIVQTDIVWENKQENLRLLYEKLQSLRGTTEIVVLPEMFSTGFSMQSKILAEPNSGETITTLKRWTSQFQQMWGNGVALPVVRIPLHGMAQLGAKTMGSLFDGSGGFPLAGLLDGIETLWASEIEPYPIAVTAWNFGGRAQVLLGGVHRNE